MDTTNLPPVVHFNSSTSLILSFYVPFPPTFFDTTQLLEVESPSPLSRTPSSSPFHPPPLPPNHLHHPRRHLKKKELKSTKKVRPTATDRQSRHFFPPICLRPKRAKLELCLRYRHHLLPAWPTHSRTKTGPSKHRRSTTNRFKPFVVNMPRYTSQYCTTHGREILNDDSLLRGQQPIFDSPFSSFLFHSECTYLMLQRSK
jgi:hypothetical protein